jgi:dipeptidyl aminopeptidase/acylaminoacyl peptidase
MAANFDDVGGGEWQDVLAGAHWAIESGIADPARMGIGGWSWGGYLSSWAITQTDRFKAAIVGAGVTNLWSDQGQNDVPDMNRLYFHDFPYSDPTPYWERSAMRHIARAKTPTLILHGQADERVAAPQAQELYRALKTLGVPTQLVLYPREPHGFTERNHQLDLLRRVLAWFDKYLANGHS